MAKPRLYKRLILLPVVLLLTVLCHVILLDTLPGNPESWLYASSGYYPSMPIEQSFPSVFNHFWSILQLDLGNSYFLGNSVSQLIYKSLPQTLFLTLCCFLGLYPIAIALSICLLCKHRMSRTLHYAFVVISSIPSCLIYTLLSIFSIYYWFDLSPYFFAIVFLIIRRVASLTSLCIKYITLERKKKYVQMAFARQVPARTIYIHYILKNGLRPIWVRIPKHFCHVVFSGTLMAEVLFSIQGFGQLSFIALKSQDYPLILGCLLTACFSISLAYVLGDFIQYNVYIKKT